VNSEPKTPYSRGYWESHNSKPSDPPVAFKAISWRGPEISD